MTQTTWTIKTTREQLPEIKVRVRPEKPHKEQIVNGRVIGDLEGFAVVAIKWFGIHVKFQVAWETIVGCLNKGSAILY